MSTLKTSPTRTSTAAAVDRRRRWSLERVLFALAGTMTLLSVALTLLVSPWFLALTTLVGVNQWLYVVVGFCPASLVLRRVTKLESGGCAR
jgi:fatty acid desaturase